MKARFPAWFKAIKMAHSPTIATAVQGNAFVQTDVNTRAACTMWHGISLMDYQACLDTIMNAVNSTPLAFPSLASLKVYMYDHIAVHEWRNNTTNAEVELEFFKLIPRTGIPRCAAAGTGTAFPTIAPPATYLYADCIRNAPELISQPFIDEAKAVTGAPGFAKVTAYDVNATPYMNPVLASMFKIKKMRVNGSYVLRLQSGQGVKHIVKHTKPRLVNFNKFGIPTFNVGLNGEKLGDVWTITPHCPLILVYARGVVAHDSTAVSNVAFGTAKIDYVVRRHWRIATPEKGEASGVTTMAPFAASTNFAATEEMANVETGAMAAEAFT